MDDRNAYILNTLWTRHYDLGRIIRFRHVTRGRQVTAYEILTAEQNTYTACLYPPAIDVAQLERIGHTLGALGSQSFPVAIPVSTHANAAPDSPPQFPPESPEETPLPEPPKSSSRPKQWAVEGPQGAHLMVIQNPVGQCLLPDQWTLADLSLLGLRLAWMHSLMLELLPLPTRPVPPTAAMQFRLAMRWWQDAGSKVAKFMLDPTHIQILEDKLEQIANRSNPTPPKGSRSVASDPGQDVVGDGGGDGGEGPNARYHRKPATLGWVHGDLQPAAILMDPDHHITSLLDWSLLHVGEPLEDVVDAFVHWCIVADGTVTDDRGRALLEAYRSLRPLPPGAWSDAVTLWLARRLVDYSYNRRILPRGYLTYLSDPEALAAALQYCDTR